jgi:hypothetical protein
MLHCNHSLLICVSLICLGFLMSSCTPNRSTTMVVDNRSIGRYCLDGVLYLQFDKMLSPAFDHQTGRVKPCPVDPAAATTVTLSDYRRVNP